MTPRFQLAGLRLPAALAALAALACGSGPLQEARQLQERGAWHQSVAPLRAALERNPDHAEANFRLGLAWLRAGRTPQAIAPLRRAAESDLYGRPAGLLLTSLYLTTGSYDEASRAASQVLELDPDNQVALVARASAAFESRRPTHALADAERVMDLNPRNLDGLSVRAASLAALQRYDEAERAFAEAYAAALDQASPIAARNCIHRAKFFGLRGGAERCRAEIHACLEKHRDDPSALALAVQAFDQLQHPAEATALLRAARERDPADAGVRTALAVRLAAGGRGREAEAVLLEGARAAGDADLWRQLFLLRAQAGDAAGARAALEEAVRIGGEARQDLRFALGGLLVEQGALAEAEAVAAGLSEPLYREVLGAQLALARGDAAAALALAEPATERAPDFEPARMAAARAANELGELDKAIGHLREAAHSAPRDSEAALLLARLHLALGEPDKALAFATRHLRQRGFTGPEAHVIGARAAAGLGRLPEARETLAALAGFAGQAGIAAAERGRLEAAAAGPAAGIASIEAAGLDLGDPANALALRMLVDLELAAGRSESALARSAEAVRGRPDTPQLLALRGHVLLRANRAAEAEAAFARALQLAREEPLALSGRGELARRAGDLRGAAALFDRAARAEPAQPGHAWAAAQAFLAAGESSEAERRLRALVHGHPELAGPANDLAWLLARRGEALDLALALARRAEVLARGPEVLDTRGFVHFRRGELDEALAAFGEALGLAPEYATARYHLGLALAARGRDAEAREALRVALATGAFPEASDARAELARLEAADPR
jgi:tetratricopeptide (TPR) repeat protein